MKTRKVFSKYVLSGLGIGLVCFSLSSCKTKGEIRREQEMDKLKSEVREARDIKVDLDTSVEELRLEVAKLTSLSEEQAAIHRNLAEDLKNQVVTLQARIQALEQRAVSEELALKQPAPSAIPKSSAVSYETGKKLFDEGKFDEALEVLRQVQEKNSKGSEAFKKTQFLIAETLFSSKDFGSSALEFAEFRKGFPKDNLVPTAIYRQAWSFKNLGKNKEARLFFQDLINRYPTHSMSQRAKGDLKKHFPNE